MRRVNRSRKVVWVARVTAPDGMRIYYGPDWNGGKATFARKGDAQAAIDEYYERTYRHGLRSLEASFGAYFETWTERRPRDRRTNRTNVSRIRQVLDVELEGRKLRDWPFHELRRRHAADLIDNMLRVQGRSRNGTVNVLSSISAMSEDAIKDQEAEVNFVKGERVRSTDPRIEKGERPPRVFTFEYMHDFCRALGNYEGMGRAFCDLGLRLAEALPLERPDLEQDGDDWIVRVRRTTDEQGEIIDLTKREKLTGTATGGRTVPAASGFVGVVQGAPRRIDTKLLWPTPTGKMYRLRNFYRDVWHPAQERWGKAKLEELGHDVDDLEGLERKELRELLAAHQLDPRPHEFRHSWESHLAAANVDRADLAEMAGHTVQTMTARYIHPLRRSYAKVRSVIG